MIPLFFDKRSFIYKYAHLIDIFLMTKSIYMSLYIETFTGVLNLLICVNRGVYRLSHIYLQTPTNKIRYKGYKHMTVLRKGAKET